MNIDYASIILILLAVGLVAAVMAVLPAWRKLMTPGQDLPLRYWTRRGRKRGRLARYSCGRVALRRVRVARRM